MGGRVSQWTQRPRVRSGEGWAPSGCILPLTHHVMKTSDHTNRETGCEIIRGAPTNLAVKGIGEGWSLKRYAVLTLAEAFLFNRDACTICHVVNFSDEIIKQSWILLFRRRRKTTISCWTLTSSSWRHRVISVRTHWRSGTTYPDNQESGQF